MLVCTDRDRQSQQPVAEVRTPLPDRLLDKRRGAGEAIRLPHHLAFDPSKIRASKRAKAPYHGRKFIEVLDDRHTSGPSAAHEVASKADSHKPDCGPRRL